MWKRLHVQYPLFLSDFNETWILSTDFRKSLNVKFHQNPSSGSQVVPCGQTDRQKDLMKLIVAFDNFANRSKNEASFICSISICVTYTKTITLSPISFLPPTFMVKSKEFSFYFVYVCFFWLNFTCHFIHFSPFYFLFYLQVWRKPSYTRKFNTAILPYKSPMYVVGHAARVRLNTQNFPATCRLQAHHMYRCVLPSALLKLFLAKAYEVARFLRQVQQYNVHDVEWSKHL
jgi:hypothetical protein